MAISSPELGKIRLVVSSVNTPAEAVEIAKANKPQLVAMFERSRHLPICKICKGLQLAVPTFDGYENFECLNCGICSGCRVVRTTASEARTAFTADQGISWIKLENMDE